MLGLLDWHLWSRGGSQMAGCQTWILAEAKGVYPQHWQQQEQRTCCLGWEVSLTQQTLQDSRGLACLACSSAQLRDFFTGKLPFP